MEKAGLKPEYIPHAVRRDVFYPRSEIALPYTNGEFVVGMVAGNFGTYDRKAFQQCFEGFALFKSQHKDAVLYVHTDVAEPNSVDLIALAKACGIAISCPLPWMILSGISQDAMAKMYSGMDVLLATSRGEGFGVPIIEAQSCGTPAIVTYATSMAELRGPGWIVWPMHKVWTTNNSWQFIPDPSGIASALEAAYGLKRDYPKVWQATKEISHAFAGVYDLGKVVSDYLIPVLRRAAEAKLE